MPKKKPLTHKKSVTAKVPKVVKTPEIRTISLTQAYLVKEQEEFHKKHKNAKSLITFFIVLTVVLAVFYFYKSVI